VSITDKTRKILWGRSGNRCAFCRVELVHEQDEHNINLNIGEECHIVSSREKGPRHIIDFGIFDDYENLILLCRNHHRTIDEKEETYTVEVLKLVKKNHENWIRTTIDTARNKTNKPKTKYYPRITSGKQIIDIVISIHAANFDHDELKTQEEVDVVSQFLQYLNDWSEMSGIAGIEKTDEIQYGFDLNKELEHIEILGFYIFGARETVRITNDKKEDMGAWDIATLLVLRQSNPGIVNSEFVATIDSGKRFKF